MGNGLHPFYRPSYNHEVEGYPSKTSVNAGERIRFHLNSQIQTQAVLIDIYRLGYYGGNGARLVHFTHAVNVMGVGLPLSNSPTGRVECHWLSQPTAFWDVPSNATSGVYLAKLTGNASGHQSFIPFVVRRDDLNSDFLFQQSVTTYQAYNPYPFIVDNSDLNSPVNGKSLYEAYSHGPTLPGGGKQAREVSFNRPYQVLTSFGIFDTAGLGFFNYEYPMIRWLESKGYYVTYATDIDTHTSPAILASGKHKALLVVGHDEYWTWEMRDNVEQARNRPNNAQTTPINIGFFGGNISYWQIRMSSSSSTNTQPAGAENRTIVAYKERATNPQFGDPIFLSGNPQTIHLTTSLWRDVGSLGGNLTKPPEDELTGVMTIPPEGDATHPPINGESPIYCCGSNQVEFNENGPAWIFAGTIGEKLPNLVGYEADEFYQSYPDRTLDIVASSTFLAERKPPLVVGTSEMVFYKMNTNNAKVFSTGSIQWPWGLDDWGADPAIGPVIPLRPASRRLDAEIVTQNILSCLLNQNAACNL